MNKRLLKVYESISDDKGIPEEDLEWLFNEYYKYSDALIDHFVLEGYLETSYERIVRLIGKYFIIIKRENEYEATELEAEVTYRIKIDPDDDFYIM